MQEIQKVRTKTFPPHLLQVCRVRQESDLHHTQNWLTTAVRHLKPCKCLYHHSQSPVNRTGKHIALKKNPGEVFSGRGKYFFPPFGTDFQIRVVVFFFFSQEKSKQEFKNGMEKTGTLPFLRQNLNGKTTGTA